MKRIYRERVHKLRADGLFTDKLASMMEISRISVHQMLNEAAAQYSNLPVPQKHIALAAQRHSAAFSGGMGPSSVPRQALNRCLIPPDLAT